MRQRKANQRIFPQLSVVIPAYNQQKTIVNDIRRIIAVLNNLNLKYEVIIVDDGSIDNTYRLIKKISSPLIRILHYDQNQGKGHAVKFGMMRANGKIIGFIDAGMDIHTNGFAMLLNHMEWYNADIIVGSKLHPASKVNYPLQRRILSWGYRFLTRILFGFKIRDTQVGIKFFKKDVIKNVLPRLLVKKYAFDIEILAVAYRLGYKKIYEAPIEINFNGNTITSLNVWATIFNMLWDTLAVFYRLKILHYYDKDYKFS